MTTIEIIITCLVAICSYLLGSVPWGYLIAKKHGVDIRTLGSKNIGATNVTRVIGKWNGRLCFLLDFLKGFAPVFTIYMLCKYDLIKDPHSVLQMVAALSAVLGHVFPIFLWFKGGKGISTTAGALIALAPYSFAISGTVWIVVYLLGRYVSLASICAAICLPLCATLISTLRPDIYYHSPYVLAFLYFISALAVLRHIGNIKRLLKGTEARFSSEKKEEEEE